MVQFLRDDVLHKAGGNNTEKEVRLIIGSCYGVLCEYGK